MVNELQYVVKYIVLSLYNVGTIKEYILVCSIKCSERTTSPSMFIDVFHVPSRGSFHFATVKSLRSNTFESNIGDLNKNF